MNRFCGNCGAPRQEGEKFCGNCGHAHAAAQEHCPTCGQPWPANVAGVGAPSSSSPAGAIRTNSLASVPLGLIYGEAFEADSDCWNCGNHGVLVGTACPLCKSVR